MSILTESQQPACQFTSSPSLAEIQREHDALLAATPLAMPTSATLLNAVQRAAAAGCRDAGTDTWLCLACMIVDIDQNGVVTDVTEVDNFQGDRRTLLPTSTLQELLLGVTAGSPVSAAAGGPAITGVTFQGAGLTGGQFRIAIQPGQAGNPPAAVPLAAATIKPESVALFRFNDTTFDWAAVTQSSFAFDNTVTPPLIRVDYNSLEADGRYRLVVNSPFDQPIVDQRMRPLTPSAFSLHVRLVDDAGTLAASNLLFE
jgi:hypothetical protein